MSGGFFRGTSFEQDTRFSNKQAKLLRTQKFASDLDHPVDTTKVKMDVIRPWIATRATELLGFEDEVLINFVYELLDGKEVDGRQIQIQLTGFLEKNTGKFMKELWGLLLSAQNIASGIPQQFLDAKEEELRKRKMESDRITQEIQGRKEKEGREFEQEKQQRMDAEVSNSRSAKAASGSNSKHPLPRASSVQRDEGMRKSTRLNGREGPSSSLSFSSQSRGHSFSPSRKYRSPPRHSLSSERHYKSPAQKSISPLHRYSPQNIWSPSRRRSAYARRRSRSISRHRSPTPIRHSPYGRTSPSFLCHRSPPSRRRSPVQRRRRSPSSARHRQSRPAHCRQSPSPTRYTSSIRRRSLSPARHRSPSPLRSISPPHMSHQMQKRSSLHSPRKYGADSQVSSWARKRNRSPYSNNLSCPTHRGTSGKNDRTNGFDSKKRQDEYASERVPEKRSSVHHALHREIAEYSVSRSNVSDHISRRLLASSRPSSQDSEGQNNIHDKDGSVPSENSSEQSDSSNHVRRISTRRNRPPENDVKQTGIRMSYYSPGTNGKEVQDSPVSDMDLPKRHVPQVSSSPNEMEFGPGRVRGEKHSKDLSYDRRSAKMMTKDSSTTKDVSNKLELKSSCIDHSVSDAGKQPKTRSYAYRESHYNKESVEESKRKMDIGSIHSDPEETDTRKYNSTEKRSHRKLDKHKRDSDDSSESQSNIEDRKEAKRRRKDERRLHKEEMRRKREKKHRKRLERHASKLSVKPMDNVTPPSDYERDQNVAGKSDDEAMKKVSHLADAKETETEEKKLEIDLREKALESLRAKKAIRH